MNRPSDINSRQIVPTQFCEPEHKLEQFFSNLRKRKHFFLQFFFWHFYKFFENLVFKLSRKKPPKKPTKKQVYDWGKEIYSNVYLLKMFIRGRVHAHIGWPLFALSAYSNVSEIKLSLICFF